MFRKVFVICRPRKSPSWFWFESRLSELAATSGFVRLLLGGRISGAGEIVLVLVLGRRGDLEAGKQDLEASLMLAEALSRWCAVLRGRSSIPGGF